MTWLANRKPRINRCRGVILIFDFCLGKSCLFNRRPHHRFGTTIEAAIHQDFAKLSSDCRLGIIGHGGVGVVPIAKNAKPLELLRLEIQPVRRKISTFLPKLRDRNLILVFTFFAILLLDLPFDWQTMAVPSRHIIGILAEHGLRPVDDIL